VRLFRLLVLMSVCLGSGCAWQRFFTKSPPPNLDEQLDKLVCTIDDDPNPLHSDYTPSVDELIELGDVAIPRMLDLMLSDNEDTRLHAQRVLEGIILKRYGFVRGRSGLKPKGEEEFRAFWKSLGGLNWEAPREERERAVKLWRVWLAKNKAQ
jgi:hypothetical protein